MMRTFMWVFLAFGTFAMIVAVLSWFRSKDQHAIAKSADCKILEIKRVKKHASGSTGMHTDWRIRVSFINPFTGEAGEGVYTTGGNRSTIEGMYQEGATVRGWFEPERGLVLLRDELIEQGSVSVFMAIASVVFFALAGLFWYLRQRG